jgi:hypothetical protein
LVKNAARTVTGRGVAFGRRETGRLAAPLLDDAPAFATSFDELRARSRTRARTRWDYRRPAL